MSGYIYDSHTKKPLSNVSVTFVNELDYSTVTNAQGYFFLDSQPYRYTNWEPLCLFCQTMPMLSKVTFQKPNYNSSKATYILQREEKPDNSTVTYKTHQGKSIKVITFDNLYMTPENK